MEKYISRTGVSLPSSTSSWFTRMACMAIPKCLADAHQELYTARAASSASELVAVVATPENVIRLYIHNAAKHTLVPWNSLVGHTDVITDLSFGQAGTQHEGYLFTSSYDGFIIGWDLRTGEPTIQIQSPGGKSVSSCTTNPKYVAAVGEFGVALWDLGSQKCIAHDQDIHTELVTFCRFHPHDQHLLFSGSDDCMVNVFNLAEAMESSQTPVLEDCLDLVLPVEQPISRFYFGGEQGDLLAILSVNEEFSAWSISSGELVVKPNCIRDALNRLVIEHVGVAEGALLGPVDDTKTPGTTTEDDLEDAAQIDRELRELDATARYNQHQRMLRTSGDDADVESKTTSLDPTYSDLVEVQTDEFGNAVYDFPVESPTAGVTVVPTVVPDKGWRVVGLIGARVTTDTNELQLAASTLLGGLIVASFSADEIKLSSVIPPASGHVDIIRECVWGPNTASIISCGQDARLVLHRRVDVEADAADRAAESRTRSRIKVLQSRKNTVSNDALAISSEHLSASQAKFKFKSTKH